MPPTIDLTPIRAKHYYQVDEIELVKTELRQDLFRYQSSVDNTKKLVEELLEIIEQEESKIEDIKDRLCTITLSSNH